MKTRQTTALVALTAMLALAACDDNPTEPNPSNNDAVVEGRVDETTPSSNPAAGPQRAPGTNAQTVSVVHIAASGEYSELASADVQADGTYRVEGVPSGRTNTAVVAYVDGREAGEVLIHGEIRSRATVRPAPITYETTMETRAYARAIASGRGDVTSSTEMALLLRTDGANVESTLRSDAELSAIADGAAEAGATMDAVFSGSGTSLDAQSRSELLVDAAAQYEADVSAGTSVEVAHEAYVDAAIDAFTGAGARLETIVAATAAAASTFDAALEGRTDIRGQVVAQPVLMNLRARQRIASEHTVSTEAVLALAIKSAIERARADVEAAESAVEVRTALETNIDATINAAADAAVELLAASASATVRADVRAAAEAALAEATLSTRLSASTTASAAASAVADYRASVRTAVEAMAEAAGTTSADVDVMTDLFIAACGGAYVR